jgi:hypothetical protein
MDTNETLFVLQSIKEEKKREEEQEGETGHRQEGKQGEEEGGKGQEEEKTGTMVHFPYKFISRYNNLKRGRGWSSQIKPSPLLVCVYEMKPEADEQTMEMIVEFVAQRGWINDCAPR